MKTGRYLFSVLSVSDVCLQMCVDLVVVLCVGSVNSLLFREVLLLEVRLVTVCN